MEKQLSFEDFLLQQADNVADTIAEAMDGEAWIQADLDTDRWVRLSELLKEWQVVDRRKEAF